MKCLYVVVMLWMTTGCFIDKNDPGTTLVYRHLLFHEKSGEVQGLLAHSSSSSSFYFRLKNAPDKVYDINTFTVNDANLIGRKGGNVAEIYDIGNGGWVEFKNGNRKSFSISGGEIEFAPSRDGEFFSLPVKKSTILRIFGQPISIERPQPSWR